jgi:hypothetical protein
MRITSRSASVRSRSRRAGPTQVVLVHDGAGYDCFPETASLYAPANSAFAVGLPTEGCGLDCNVMRLRCAVSRPARRIALRLIPQCAPRPFTYGGSATNPLSAGRFADVADPGG